ncbi:hypothetical protein ELE36_00170 [Pseudolysobacter antarcticus]|uniref:Uncharacterized protein n=1 Tax=Pseudolysobacter antarcticus TaxID=2511995 RepID=A0A411HEM3_9GAMM|nr:hypothetical protein [Pseudolysobacter antarcticus]QBB68917.1 hypothetical protein ELE36_00170 [Pseudolysobacter antarcticus]
MSDSTTQLVTSSPRLRKLLSGADVDPPAALWPRIVAAHALQLQQRRRRRWFASLAAAACLLIAMVLLPRFIDRTPNAAQSVDWKSMAQQLELRLQDLDNAQMGQAASLLPEQADLEALDHCLQAAYDHAAGNAELMSLWQRRYALLNTLLTVRSQQQVVTRI